MGRNRQRRTWQETALTIAVYLILSQLSDLATARAFGIEGMSPVYPSAALNVLVLILLGWRFWPIVPVNALLHVLLVEQRVDAAWPSLVTQTVVGMGYGIGVRYVVDRLRISLPPRTLRDVAWFCGILGVAAPVAIGLVSTSVLVAAGYLAVDDLPQQFSRFVLGDASAIVVLAPTLLVFLRWRQLIQPAEHQDPPRTEAALSMIATAVLVAVSHVLSSVTRETVLDLSFIAVAWLAIRFAIRGAAAGIATAYAATFVAIFTLHESVNAAVQSQMFLFASALMGWLLAGLTSERWELLARLSRRAYVDDLTGLPNRERLIEWITRHQDSPVVLVIMDVDDMRLLNQGVGRVAADHVLQEMAIRMRATFPSSTFVARVSADEFAVAVVDDRSPHAIMAELRQFFEAPFDADGSRVYISVSMGAVRTIRAGSADELLRKADMALDRAKSSPARSIVYSPELQAGEAPSLVGELHRAVENHELVPFYQPIYRYDLRSNSWQVAGAEALLRWIHPERGIVTPAHFIDFLERLTIGDHVGWDVMEQALLQAGEWRREIPNFRVWVNLFARQALARDCDRRIVELLHRTAVAPDALVVEINEGIVASDERDIASLVSRLREVGVQCAIDDFGTGGSSLGRVRDVPASVLKIDRSFVNKSEVDAKAKAVAATVVRLANELGMTVVAEGVENTMQLDVMMETGAHFVQGYALGHPLPADLFARTFLTADRATAI
ncbi:MAG: EAL domain-containing protein [Candidatus Eremiobacteraeota bacterium]|nr:EAL domain-containing protein [Candidatus Eremiobacteraeota bacterium]